MQKFINWGRYSSEQARQVNNVWAYHQKPKQAPVDYAGMILHVARLEHSLGRLEEARRTLDDASALLSGDPRGLSAEMLFLRARLLLDLKEAGPALALLSQPAATAALAHSPQRLEEAQLYRGEAYSMLGSLPRARAELLPLADSPQRNLRLLARFHLGNLHLWQNEPDQAVEFYSDILENELGHELANDVLDMAVSAKLYSPEEMGHYSLALLYSWQGRRDDAVEEWRMLAALAGRGPGGARVGGSGDIFAASGDLASASAEFAKALRFAQNADVVGRIRWAMLEEVERKQRGEVARPEYEKLIVDFPDTLFADLARRRLQAEKPKPPVEPRP
ncbi:hypothetical protein HS125_10600 [bacterium]|nr:hypothetical protein [bacterium]